MSRVYYYKKTTITLREFLKKHQCDSVSLSNSNKDLCYMKLPDYLSDDILNCHVESFWIYDCYDGDDYLFWMYRDYNIKLLDAPDDIVVDKVFSKFSFDDFIDLFKKGGSYDS